MGISNQQFISGKLYGIYFVDFILVTLRLNPNKRIFLQVKKCLEKQKYHLTKKSLSEIACKQLGSYFILSSCDCVLKHDRG